MVSTEFLDKFKKLYKDKYNIILSDEEATRLGTHFLNLMKILIKPKPNTNINQEDEPVCLESEVER